METHPQYCNLLIIVACVVNSAFGSVFENTDPQKIIIEDPNVEILTELPSGDVNLKSYRAPLSVIDNYSKQYNIEKGDVKDFSNAPNCTRAEIEALRHWTTNDIYEEVNQALRLLHKGKVKGAPLDPKVESEILVIASAVNCAPQYQGTVVREEKTPQEILDQYQVGKYIVARAFTSTTKGTVSSHSISQADQEIVVTNAEGADIDSMGIASWPNEKEVLLRPGMVFKVVKKETLPPPTPYKNLFTFLIP